MRKFLFLVLALLFLTPSLLMAQRLEPLGGHPSAVQQDSTGNVKFFSNFRPAHLVAPVALFGAGVIGNSIDAVKEFDFGFSGSGSSNVHKGFVFEDVTQYVPAAGYYMLRLGGIKSAYNYGDATVMLALSYAINAVATKAIKEIADVQRPNGADNNSFPSGHSSISFMGAEFLRLQYKDTTPWIGIAGYAVATGTAVARVAHNEHWVTDVMAGAGVGILSSRVAYWIYPWVQEKIVHKIFKPKKDIALMGLPYCSGNGAGISLAMSF